MARLRSIRSTLPGFAELVRYRLRAVFVGPLIFGALVAFILAFVPQSREVYLATIKDMRFDHAVLGFILIALLCVQLDCWHRMLGRAAIDRTYPEHANVEIDVALDQWNTSFCRAAALLPMLGLALGVGSAVYDWLRADVVLSENSLLSEQSLASLGVTVAATQQNLAAYVVKIGIAALIMLVALVVYYAIRWLMGWSFVSGSQTQKVRKWTVRTLAVLSLLAVGLPLSDLSYDYLVPVSQTMGPIAAGALVMIIAVSVLIGLSYISNILRVPVVGSLMFVLLAVLVWHVVSGFSPPEDGRDIRPGAGRPAAAPETPNGPQTQFSTWLNARADLPAFEGQDRPYPVFIVASQGGGIYAAATTLAFMSAMQDECPAFAQHVFAISGVSGGAVGAAIFNALTADAPHATNPNCIGEIETGAPQGNLAEASAIVVERDHLSAALLQIWPDVIRKTVTWVSGFEFSFDRSTAIERSVACAFSKAERGSWLCPRAHRGSHLRVPFHQHWNPEGVSPGLILSATWGETGYRAAFAPYPLHDISDGTNYTFPIKGLPGDFAEDGFDMDKDEPSLVEAAFVSARFPGIVPAYAVEFKSTRQGGTERLWNFVDGGYVDNSGATTALELYTALKASIPVNAATGKKRAKIYLLLLTDVTTDPDLAEVETGTEFSDTVAPVTALLSVRAQLANRAVKRALDVLTAEATKEELAGRAGTTPDILVVNLKQKVYSFPLGWKISRVTHDIIRQLLGGPDKCEPQKYNNLPPDDWRRVINDNSCVKARIRDLVSGQKQ